MRIKRDVADDLFSKLVRERAGWACENCHKYYPEGHRAGLECSHFYGRRHKSIRWHPMNAAAHCTRCHMKLGGDPVEFSAWIRGFLGPQKFNELQVMQRGIMKVPAWYKKEIVKNLRAELKRLTEERATGKNGRLEFKSPY